MNASPVASKRKPATSGRTASLLPKADSSTNPDYGTKAFAERLSKKFHQAKRRAVANTASLKK